MDDRKVLNLAIMVGLLLILLAGLVGLIQATPARAAPVASAWERSGTSGGAERISLVPADLPARPGLVLPPSLPPGEPLLQTPVLTITKRDNPDPVDAGSMLIYTIVVHNSGDGPVTDTIITDELDTRVNFVSASDGGTSNSGVVTWSPVPVGAGLTITRSLQVKVASNVPGGASLSNTANVTSTAGTNDSVTINTLVQTSADLSISKTDSSDPVVAGTSFSYNLSIRNNGPSDASGVSISDQLPTGLTFNPSGSSGGCSVANGLVTCTVGNLSANGTTSRTIVVNVAASAVAGTVSNTASVSGSQPDPVSGNNSSSQTTTINRQADLSITKTDSNDPVVAGTSFSYNLSIRNNGPSDASGVSISDQLPTGLTFNPSGSSGGCSVANGLVTCTVGNLSANGTTSRTIVVDVASGLADGTVLTNVANVLGIETDPSPGNNFATQTTTVNRPADLSITKTDSSDPVVAGSSFSYNLSVTNHGPFNASGVSISDTLPAGLTFNPSGSSGGCSVVNGPVICIVGNLSVNGTENRTIVVNVAASAVAGMVSNTASVSGSQPDPVSGNNSSTETTTIIRQADLSISKTDSNDPVVAGTSFSYNLSIRNNGPSNASGVSISDQLPTGLTFNPSGSSGGCSVANGLVTCTVGNLSANGTTSRTIVVDVASGLAEGPLSNTASVSSSQIDPSPGNNSSTETTTIIRRTDLRITKTDSSDPVVAGTWFSYNLSIRNNGPSNASGVRASDQLPAGLTFRSSDSSSQCSAVGQQVTCTVGNLSANGTENRTIAVDAAAWLAEGPVSNTASVSGDQTDPVAGNNSGSQSTTIHRRADLGVSLSDSADPVGIGGAFTYHVTVTNNGPSDASGVSVSDTLPAELSFKSSGSSSECLAVGQQVTCTVGNLAAGHGVVLAVAVDVDDALADGTLLSNTVIVSANETDPNGGNNSATEGTLSKVFKTYLPVILRSLTELSVFNDNTGGDVTFTVVGAGVSCVVPNNTTQFCGSFEPGTYTVRVSSLCGEAEAVKTYQSGPVITRVYCK